MWRRLERWQEFSPDAKGKMVKLKTLPEAVVLSWWVNFENLATRTVWRMKTIPVASAVPVQNAGAPCGHKCSHVSASIICSLWNPSLREALSQQQPVLSLNFCHWKSFSLMCFVLFCFFIYFWLCWIIVAAHGLSLVAASGGYSSLWCVGFLLR